MIRELRILISLLLLVFFAGGAFDAMALTDGKKQVAVFNSYNEVAPWPRKYINHVIQEVALHPDFNTVRVTHLNNNLIFDQEDYDEMEDYVFASYETPPDYLVLVGNFSFNLRDRIKQEWGDIPMLLVCMSSRYAPLDYYFTQEDNNDNFPLPDFKPLEDLRDEFNFSIVLTPNKQKETVDMMVEMFPDMKKLVFMGDGLYINRHLSHVIREYLAMKYPNMEYEWLFAGQDGVMLPYLNSPDPNIGLLLSTWYYTENGLWGFPLMNGTDSFLINSSKHPVFGMRHAYMSYGILGGYFSSPDEVYEDMIAALDDLITGKEMRNVPFRIPTEAFPMIDYNRLKTLDLSVDICPPDTVFINKPVSFWEIYRTQLWIALGLTVLALIALVCLIYSRKKPRLRRAYDSLVNSMPIGYLQAQLDLDRNGTVKKVRFSRENKALKALVEDHKIREFETDMHTTYWQETADSLIAEPEPKSSIIKDAEGENFIELLVNPAENSTDQKMFVDIFAIDVTDKMKVEHVLREAARKAVEADNMKSAFLTNMSHEIRTPLNAIVGFSNLLCKTTDPTKKKKFIEIIETNNQLLLKLIGDILDISKADSDKLVFNMYKVDVNKLISTACSGIDMTNRPNVKMVMKPGLEECFVTSDPYRITQVLNNLLTNAVKFTERGTITVGYDVVHDDMLRFYVKDTGLGIAAADMSKLFTRFTKLNSFIQGTGLGLSISKQIVEKLGGTMRAESAGRGQGSTFYFTIPYVLKEAGTVEDSEGMTEDQIRLEALKRKAMGGNQNSGTPDHNISISKERTGMVASTELPSYKRERKKILVVEDNESNYELFDELLSERYDIVRAADGEEAIKMYAQETPDLIVMDINLPYKDGYEATSEIRLLSKTVPIIAVTAYAQQTDRERVMNSGFDSYLSKPVDEESLLAEIRKLL